MAQEKIRVIERSDLGPVLARADHLNNVVEVNAKAFYGLPPMFQEFVLCHEVCHLEHDEWDEERTNRLAVDLFLSRAVDDDDRERRERFLSNPAGGEYSNFAWGALIAGILSAGTTVYGIITNSNAGWYSWEKASQQSNIDAMLTQAFEQSRRTSQHSAQEYLWAQLQQYTNKDNSLEQFLGRSKNSWVKSRIAQYEEKYGHKIDEVTPIDITAFPMAIAAIGIVIGLVLYKIIKNKRK